jgi:hypothetical protein
MRSETLITMRPKVALAYGIAMQAEVRQLERENVIQIWDSEGLNTILRILQRHAISERATAATLVAFSASLGCPYDRDEVTKELGLQTVQIIDAVLYMLECVRQSDVDEVLIHARVFKGLQKNDILASFAAFQVYAMVAVEAQKDQIFSDGLDVSHIEDLSIPDFVMTYDKLIRAVARMRHSIYDEFAERWMALREEFEPLVSE